VEKQELLIGSDVRGWFMGVFELGLNIIISVSAWNQILTSISVSKAGSRRS